MIKRTIPAFTLTILLMLLNSFQVSNATPLVLKMKSSESQQNIKPAWLVLQNSYFYDGETDDLVTAGYGFSQLSQFQAEDQFVDPNNPTFHELRKSKLNRYIDTRSGEGSYFGFQTKNLTSLFDGRIAGTEIQAYLDKGGDKVAFLLQVPLDFDAKKACIIAIPTMDAAGIYNAQDMQIRGLWGLNHHCAVVYNDKGLGNALFDLAHQTGYLIDGQVASQSTTENPLLFSVDIKVSESEQYTNRYAVKQLHSQQNPEERWGEYVLNSIEFAFYQLNEMFSLKNETLLDKNNTHVLVYGVNDGGGAALKAGEADLQGVIDGIVAVNPQIQIGTENTPPLFIQHGELPIETLQVKSLIDYSTYAALYLPCAIAALKEDNYPYTHKFYFAKNRCQALNIANLLSTETTEEQASEALNKLYQYGWTEQMANQLAYHYFEQSINLPYRYISQYGRYGVDEKLCNYSVASINQEVLYNSGTVSPLNKTNFARLWASNNGSLPVKIGEDVIAIDLVNESDPKGPRRELYSRSQDSKDIDYNLLGAMCLSDSISEKRVQTGLQAVLSTGKLNQINTIIVHGQLNVRNLPNYTARAYVALNSYQEGRFSNLRYIEVENASYINNVTSFDNTLIPIDYYGENAMNWLWNHITQQASLPDSQIIRTIPRGGQMGFAPTINQTNLTPISQIAKQENRIHINNGTIIFPK